MKFRILVLIFSFFLMTACHKKTEEESIERRKMGEGKVEVTVPTAVWKEIEKDYIQFNLGKKPEAGETEKVEKEEKKPSPGAEPHKMNVDENYLKELTKKRPPTDSFPLTVELTEKTEGVLGKKNFILQYPLGGGILELSQFVSERPQGSFYLRIKWDEKQWPMKYFKAYFVSRSKMKTMDGKVFGSGCDHFFNLTEYFKSSMKGQGFFLNTNNLRHISLIAGIYYFNVFKDGKIYWSSLEIIDSRHRELLCVPD